jgi:aromatic ring-opening dioxygenase LigB subunit
LKGRGKSAGLVSYIRGIRVRDAPNPDEIFQGSNRLNHRGHDHMHAKNEAVHNQLQFPLKSLTQNVIEQKIFIIRGHNVILDRDLAILYEVKPIVLRQQVRRNLERFPEDFMFQLNQKEAGLLVSQNVIPSRQSLGGHLPYVFTEEGIAMLSGVLRSKRAIQVNIAIMRAFVKLRRILSSQKELARKLQELERKIENHDKEIIAIFDAIRRLMRPPLKLNRKIGF